MNHYYGKDLRNTCPECGAWLVHEGGCATCRLCGLSMCGRWTDTLLVFGLVVALIALGVTVL